MAEEIRVVISGDSSKLEAEILGLKEQLSGLSKGSGSSAPMAPLDKGLQATARTARVATEQMRNLSYQVTDIVSGLLTGQNPFFILVQQGGQLKDIFGGVLPTLKALGSLLTITRVAVGGLGAVVGTLAYGMYSGAAEAKELDKQLRLVGQSAGVSANQYRDLTKSIAASRSVPVGDVRETAGLLIKPGEFSGQLFRPALDAATAFQKASGASSEDASKLFSGMTRDVASWAETANRSYHFVTAAQLDQIRVLQAQHRETEAARLSLALFADDMGRKAVPAASGLGGVIDYLSRSTSEWWSGIKDLIPSLEDGFKTAKSLADLLTIARYASPNVAEGQRQRLLTGRDQADAEQELQRQRARADARQAEIDASSPQRVAARIAVEQSAIELRLQNQANGFAAGLRQNERAYDLGLTAFSAYQDKLTAIQLAQINAREDAAKAEAAALASRKDLTPEARTQAANDLLRKQAGFAGERAQVRGADRSARDANDAAREANAYSNPLDAPGRAIRGALERRDDASLEARRNLALQTRQLSVDLIRDERTRGEASIALEREQLERSLQLNTRTAEEKKQIEEELATWQANRQEQLNRELRPVWQQQLEDWRNFEKLKRDSTDEALNGIVRNTEDAFVTLVTRGRLNLKTLLKDFLAVQARMVFRNWAGGSNLFGSALSFLGSAFSGGFSTAGSAAAGVAASDIGIDSIGFGGPRARGGDVGRGRLYQINETGSPEVLSTGGRDYLMMGASSGRVTSAQGGSTVAVSMPLTLHIDSRTDQAQIAQIATAAVQEGQRQMFNQLRQVRVLG